MNIFLTLDIRFLHEYSTVVGLIYKKQMHILEKEIKSCSLIY